MTRLFQHRDTIIGLILLAIGLALPLLLQSSFQLRIAMLVWVYAILGLGFNLLFGLAGQLSLGQQGFFAIAAYALALLQTKLGAPLVVAFPAALIICALLAAVVGLPLLRLRSHYLAMATLMFGLIIEGLALRWFDVTGGSAGVRVPPIAIGDWRLARTEIYYLVFGLAAIAYLIHSFLLSTFAGRAFQAIRGDETAARSLGVNVTAYKLRVFVLAAVFAGLAGATYALVSRQVDPSYSALTVNINLLTIAVVGGFAAASVPFWAQRSWYWPLSF
jgi:branched-chain amino acid transport system permease protein